MFVFFYSSLTIFVKTNALWPLVPICELGIEIHLEDPILQFCQYAIVPNDNLSKLLNPHSKKTEILHYLASKPKRLWILQTFWHTPKSWTESIHFFICTRTFSLCKASKSTLFSWYAELTHRIDWAEPHQSKEGWWQFQ